MIELEKVKLATNILESRLYLFEKKYPNNTTPRDAVKEIKSWLNAPTKRGVRKIGSYAHDISALLLPLREGARASFVGDGIMWLCWCVDRQDGLSFNDAFCEVEYLIKLIFKV